MSSAGGRAGLSWVEESTPWRGARWLVETQEGQRLPATLSMLLFDSSGVNKDASLNEHRQALERVTEAVAEPGAEPMVASGAVEVTPAHRADARMLVLAAAPQHGFDPASIPGCWTPRRHHS